jgi:hypothetical protein
MTDKERLEELEKLELVKLKEIRELRAQIKELYYKLKREADYEKRY